MGVATSAERETATRIGLIGPNPKGRTIVRCRLARVQEQPFQVVSDFAPAGDQPKAIAGLSEGILRGDRFQTLLGITGSGKSATIAWTIEKTQKPTLILAPNKSLAAQLAQEMREFFPHNRVEYFVSYYDYYQPEAYIPSSDTYIEKDSSINDEIDRLRHSATAALLTRRDVIVVASVSCIYGMGNPEEYRGNMIDLSVGVDYDMRSILRKLVDLQFDRNDAVLSRGRFRVRGDTIEVHPSYEETVLRIEMFGDTVDRLTTIDPITGETLQTLPAHPDLPGHPLRRRRRADGQGDDPDRGRAAGAAGLVRGRGQAARGPAAAHAHAVRPRDDGRGRLLQRHRELLDAHRRPRLRRAAVHAARLLPRRLPARHRREPPGGAPAARAVRGRPQPQGHARRPRLPPAVGPRQPAADVRRGARADQPGRVHVGDAERLRAAGVASRSSSRSSARPASSTRRSSSSRPRARSTTSSRASTTASPRATGCSSRR